MALSLLPSLMELSLKKHPEIPSLRILSATSGDTGSAVLASFRRTPSIGVSILYPEGGVAPIQERQMLSFSSISSRAYALQKSNFDDAQTLVKKLLLEQPYGQHYSSANSINIARLLPQVVYYYASYLRLVNENWLRMGETLDVVVPTGNFGDIFAAYLAKKMGLPLGRLVVASNANAVLTDFLKDGVYEARRNFYKTNSPSMDILVSSNLERLLYCVNGDAKQVSLWEASLTKEGRFAVDNETLQKIQADFAGFSIAEEGTNQAIRSCYQKWAYLLDPHSAVGYGAYQEYRKGHPKGKALVVATASPLKFPRTVLHALGKDNPDELGALSDLLSLGKLNLPFSLKKSLLDSTPAYPVTASTFRKILSPKRSFVVTSYATSANLGPGFDALGIALSLKNVFSFSLAKEDSLKGFSGEEELKDNLVLRSYHRYFEELHCPYPPVQIEQLEQGIPLSRGLGSSASCIVSGLSAANEIAGRLLNPEQLLSLATSIEGHPDNVAPALFGGLVSSYKDNEGTLHVLSYPVSSSLGFLLLIPPQELSTALARGVLPKSYPLSDVTYQASHLLPLLKAFEEGDLPLLEELLLDRIHVPYRLPLIQGGEQVRDLAHHFHLPFTISGAGSSLLVLYKKEDQRSLAAFKEKMGKDLPAFRLVDLIREKKGVSIREVSSYGD
jgi:threonine synthase